MNTRREFLGWMAGAAAMAPRMWPLPREEWAAPEPASEGRRYNGWVERTLDVPEMLDHICWGAAIWSEGLRLWKNGRE